MVDQELLSAIQTLIQTEISGLRDEMKQEISGLKAETKQEISTFRDEMKREMEAQEIRVLNGVKVIFESDIQPQINLIYEDVQLIRERQMNQAAFENLESKVLTHETAIKIHTQEIQALKKAL